LEDRIVGTPETLQKGEVLDRTRLLVLQSSVGQESEHPSHLAHRTSRFQEALGNTALGIQQGVVHLPFRQTWAVARPLLRVDLSVFAAASVQYHRRDPYDRPSWVVQIDPWVLVHQA
jgi:hypothetical protein